MSLGDRPAADSGPRCRGPGRRLPGKAPGTRCPRPRGPGASAGWKRWMARDFRVRGGSCASGEWRHCNTSEREGRGVEGERYAPTTFLSRRPAHWHPRGGGHADGYLSPPARTGPAPATCGKLHILRAVRRPPRHAKARGDGSIRALRAAVRRPPPDTRRRATPRSQPDRHRRRRPRHAEAQGAVLCRPGADVVRRPSPRHAEARGPGRTRRRRGGRAGRGARGEGRRAPARRRGGRRGKANKRVARPASANEKARDRWVSAGSGPALIVRGGGLEPP